MDVPYHLTQGKDISVALIKSIKSDALVVEEAAGKGAHKYTQWRSFTPAVLF